MSQVHAVNFYFCKSLVSAIFFAVSPWNLPQFGLRSLSTLLTRGDTPLRGIIVETSCLIYATFVLHRHINKHIIDLLSATPSILQVLNSSIAKSLLVYGSILTFAIILDVLTTFQNLLGRARLETESHGAPSSRTWLVSKTRAHAPLLVVTSWRFGIGAVTSGTYGTLLTVLFPILENISQLIFFDQKIVDEIINFFVVVMHAQIIWNIYQEVSINVVFNQVPIQVWQLVREKISFEIDTTLFDLLPAALALRELLRNLFRQMFLKSLFSQLLFMLTNDSHMDVRRQ